MREHWMHFYLGWVEITRLNTTTTYVIMDCGLCREATRCDEFSNDFRHYLMLHEHHLPELPSMWPPLLRYLP